MPTETVPPLVMLIDDEDDQLYVMRRLVSKAFPGVGVVDFRSGAEAMEYLLRAQAGGDGTAGRPAVIFLDYHMPGIDGPEFLRRMRANRALADLNVIIVSSSEDPNDMRQAVEAGADGYLVKHPGLVILACVLRQAVAGDSSLFAGLEGVPGVFAFERLESSR